MEQSAGNIDTHNSDTPAPSPATAALAPPRKTGFSSLLITQFFGAVNDNILKQILIFMASTGLWKNKMGTAGEAWIAVIFTLPFIALSGYAGQFADRNSKQWVVVLLKVIEIPIVGIAMIGFWMQSLPITLGALLVLSVHSTFFGPAKYGMIPELVAEENLSRANGTMNMLTNIAVIVGTLLAGPIADRYFPSRPNADGSVPTPMLWLPGAALLVIAVFGLAASFLLPRLRACDPTLRYTLNPVATYIKSIREMAQGPLLMVALAWSLFYLLASTALLILPHYTTILGIDYTQNSYLLGAMGVAIGVGSMLAGLISGKHIEPRLIPIGAVGMFIAFVLLGSLTPMYWGVMALLVVAGTFAGLYIVPLQALLQKLSPDGERGRFLGTANAMSFTAFTLGAAVEWLATNVAHLPPNRVFLVVAAISLLGTSAMLWKMRSVLRR